MSKVQNTLIGRASGSVGQVVFVTWKGINVARSKPISVANPNTIPQQKQRSRFSLMRTFYFNAYPIIDFGVQLIAIKMSRQNAFLKTNINNAVYSGVVPNIALVYSAINISKGSMVITKIDFVTAFSITAFTKINWTILFSGIRSNPNDKAYALMFNETQNRFLFFSDGIRSDGDLTLNLSVLFGIGDILHSWLFFVSPDGKFISDSSYLTHTVPF